MKLRGIGAVQAMSLTSSKTEYSKVNDSETNEGYVLVTPAKNEEGNLARVARGIIAQTVVPSLWVIVDDGSTDRTSQIIQDLVRQRNWIIGMSLPGGARDTHLRYAEVCRKGFDFATNYLNKNGIDSEFVGLVDADTVIEPRFFEKLIYEFRKDRNLGVASGGLFYEKEGQLQLESGDRNSPRGTGRLWRKKCFFETGGYVACQAPPDTISNVKAKLLGYRARQFQSIMAVQLRATASAEGFWAGYQKKGMAWHYLNAHPALVLLNVIGFSAQRPRFRGVAFFLGYFAAFVRRQEKIDDEEVRRYFWGQRSLEVIAQAIGKHRFEEL